MNNDNILKLLQDGNQRFVEKKTKKRTKNPSELSTGQTPHSIIITCADSRVPPELIFDQDLGDLFVIRIAGNIVTDEVIGSAEYAASQLGSSTCIVLGHTNCGAVGAAVDCIKSNSKMPSPGLESVITPILKSINSEEKEINEAPLDFFIESNIKSALSQLTSRSDILKKLYDEKKLNLYGAKYSLESGKVDFLF